MPATANGSGRTAMAESSRGEIECGADGEFRNRGHPAAAACSPGSNAAKSFDSDGERAEVTLSREPTLLPTAAVVPRNGRLCGWPSESSEAVARRAVEAAVVAAKESECAPATADEAGMPRFTLGLAAPKTKGVVLEGAPPYVSFAGGATGSCDAELAGVAPLSAQDACHEEEPGRETISFSVETVASPAPVSALPIGTDTPCLSAAELRQPVLPPPGLQQPQPSLGSELHGTGQCQPCAWFWKPSSCSLGAGCSFCHLCPDGELKARKKQKHALLSLGLLTPKARGNEPARPTSGESPPPAAKDSDPGSTTASEESGSAGSGSDSEAGKGVAPAGTQPPDSLCSAASREDGGAARPRAKSADGGVLAVPPGLVPPPQAPSHGSVLHGAGSCQPCAWFWKPGGCQNGADCGYCHLCPESEIKARKKTKQAQMRLGLVTPKACRQVSSGGTPLSLSFALSAGAPEFHMPAGCGFSADAPVFQPRGDVSAFGPVDARVHGSIEVRDRQAHALDRMGLATPKPARAEAPGGFSLILADVV